MSNNNETNINNDDLKFFIEGLLSFITTWITENPTAI